MALAASCCADGPDNTSSSPSGSPRGSPKAPSVLGRRLSGLSREGSATTSLRVEHDAVSEEEKGDLLALPLDQALFMLDKAWDSVFDFHSGSKVSLGLWWSHGQQGSLPQVECMIVTTWT